jgi:hypothetical protein
VAAQRAAAALVPPATAALPAAATATTRAARLSGRCGSAARRLACAELTLAVTCAPGGRAGAFSPCSSAAAPAHQHQLLLLGGPSSAPGHCSSRAIEASNALLSRLFLPAPSPPPVVTSYPLSDDPSPLPPPPLARPARLDFLPVEPGGALHRMAAAWHFPAFAVALGDSYFQRLLAAMPHLAAGAARLPAFSRYIAAAATAAGAASFPSSSSSAAAAAAAAEAAAEAAAAADSDDPAAAALAAAQRESTLRSIQFTCVFVATKVVDQVHALGLLRFMLSALAGGGGAQGQQQQQQQHGRHHHHHHHHRHAAAGGRPPPVPPPPPPPPPPVVTLAQAADVEARCLRGLGWRLGPVFAEDPLAGGDAETARLLAEALGREDDEGDEGEEERGW